MNNELSLNKGLSHSAGEYPMKAEYENLLENTVMNDIGLSAEGEINRRAVSNNDADSSGPTPRPLTTAC